MTAPIAPSPQAILMPLLFGKAATQAASVAAKYRIADRLVGGPKTAAELAAEAKLHAGNLHRILRALAGAGVFQLDSDGRFSNNSVSELLRYDLLGSMRPMADYLGDPWCWAPYSQLANSVQTGEPPFEKTFGEGIFDYLGKHPGEANTFNEGMTGFSESIAAEVVKAYDFGPFRTVIDVGGGHGSLLMAILKSNLKLRGIVFDADSIAVGAERAIENAGMDQRCRAEGGDFFVSVPEGGDLYMMKHILHDWNDAKALKILKACRAAIQPGGKILLVELVVPEESGPSMAHWLDLEMLVVCDGKERTAKEYAELFAASGFRQSEVIPLPGGPHCLIEAVPVEVPNA